MVDLENLESGFIVHAGDRVEVFEDRKEAVALAKELSGQGFGRVRIETADGSEILQYRRGALESYQRDKPGRR